MNSFKKNLGDITRQVLSEEYPHLNIGISDIQNEGGRIEEICIEAIELYLVSHIHVDGNGLDYFNFNNRKFR